MSYFFLFSTLCKVLIGSEVILLSHLRGKKHQDAIRDQNNGNMLANEELESYNLKHIVEAPSESKVESDPALANLEKEKLKAKRKRLKKLKQKLLNKGAKIEEMWKKQVDNSKISSSKVKLSKIIKDINALNTDDKISGLWPTNMVHSLNRHLNSIDKLLRDSFDDQAIFASPNVKGIECLEKLLNRLLLGTNEKPASFPDKTFIQILNLYSTICAKNMRLCKYVFETNRLLSLLDCFLHRLNVSLNIKCVSKLN